MSSKVVVELKYINCNSIIFKTSRTVKIFFTFYGLGKFNLVIKPAEGEAKCIR